jgi:hypothetical protein
MTNTLDLNVDYKKNSVFFGMLFGITSSLLLYLDYKFGLGTNMVLIFTNICLIIFFIFYPIHKFKIDNTTLSISQALKIGLIVGAIGGLVYAVYTFFHYTYLDPEFVSETLELQKEALTENPDATNNDNTSVGTIFSFSTFSLLTQISKSFFISLIIGLIKKS